VIRIEIPIIPLDNFGLALGKYITIAGSLTLLFQLSLKLEDIEMSIGEHRTIMNIGFVSINLNNRAI
jgi:hypothetical protein